MNVLKAARQTLMTGLQTLPGGLRGQAGGWGRWFNSGSSYDWSKYTGLVWENCVVWLALEFIKRNWAEAPLQIQEFDGKSWVPSKDQTLATALDNPNDWYDGNTLFQATVLSHFSAGNAYWLNLRRNNGLPAPFLMWHHLVSPNTNEGPWITDYLYRPPGAVQVSFDPSVVVHFRNGLAVQDQRVGTAPLAACYRSVASDNLGEIFDGALLHKMGVPGLIISGDLTDDQNKALKAKIDEKFTVDGAGSTLTAGKELSVTAIKATPRDMMLGDMRKLPVGRVCGAFGLDPGVLSLPSDTSKHHANFDAMLKAAWTQCLRPLKNDFGRTLTHFYRMTGDLKPNQRIGWDFSQVSELQPDRTESATVATTLYQGGVAKLNEARGLVGLEEVQDGDSFYDPGGGSSPEAQKLQQMGYEDGLRKANQRRMLIESGELEED